jgi:hypothetical protein
VVGFSLWNGQRAQPSSQTATPEQVWALWADVEHWHEWDHEVLSSSINGAFAVGATGVLKPKGGPSVRFSLTEVNPMAGFSNVASLPLTKLEFHHRVVPHGDGSRIEHTVVLRGLLTFFFRRVLGVKIARSLPDVVASLAQSASTVGTPTTSNSNSSV